MATIETSRAYKASALIEFGSTIIDAHRSLVGGSSDIEEKDIRDAIKQFEYFRNRFPVIIIDNEETEAPRMRAILDIMDDLVILYNL